MLSHPDVPAGDADHADLRLFAPLHLTNSLTGLVVVYTAFNIPFAAFLMQSFFDGIPRIWRGRDDRRR